MSCIMDIKWDMIIYFLFQILIQARLFLASVRLQICYSLITLINIKELNVFFDEKILATSLKVLLEVTETSTCLASQNLDLRALFGLKYSNSHVDSFSCM